MKGREIALCGLLTALAETLLLLGGILPLATFCAPLLAMAVLLPVLEEYGCRAAAAAYGAAAILSLVLVADKETALVFVFFGWYPLLRPRIARLPSPLLRTAARLAVCTGLIAALYGLTLHLLGLTADLEGGSRLMNCLLLVLGNATFLAMDVVLARLTLLWHTKLRRRFFRA
ncbi:hypothetical protein [Oscillibacter sp.]|uniref:hypothetical protein n=1 Tax=Oscillibacter sp. TaxID=1945593 RepID=UPI00262BA60E|nr:hypothetical protein [Oscillibacter sp.]MDD3347698.1 hypothetical protein [Oscillibacter sp.]